MVCAVLLLVLAVALRSLARRAAEVRRWRPAALADLAMKGWYATVLAAVVAAVVDGRLMRWFAPRGESGPAAEHLGWPSVTPSGSGRPGGGPRGSRSWARFC